jgi:hypothetical protein
MVGVAQLVEHLVVVQDVAGSSPVTHPGVGQSEDRGTIVRRCRDPLPIPRPLGPCAQCRLNKSVVGAHDSYPLRDSRRWRRT